MERLSDRHRKTLAAILASTLIALLACGNSRERELAYGVTVVKEIIEGAGRSPVVAKSLGAPEEGNLILWYVLQTLPPDGGALRNFKLDRIKPSRPWAVVIRQGGGPRDFVVEGYGESLAKPLYTETARVRGG